MKPILFICFFFWTIVLCSNNTSAENQTTALTQYTFLTDTSFLQIEPFESDTTMIASRQFVLTVYRNDTTCFFTVQKFSNGRYKVIMKDFEYSTNNSSLFFKDQNKDGFMDIVWTKKWQDHAYLFNPLTENFVEVGEFHDVDTLKNNGTPILYENRYPLLYYWNYEKTLETSKCREVTMFSENHSELFIINNNYQKLSFASMDNFSTVEGMIWDTIACGAQVITCYVPPYSGKFDEYNIWNSGKVVDSFWLAKDSTFYNGDWYAIDSTYITNYWMKNYSNLLEYGQIFKVRRQFPIEFYR